MTSSTHTAQAPHNRQPGTYIHPNMSLRSLPTELGLHVLEHLCTSQDRSALSPLSSVSKYWRGATESFLYGELNFRASEDIQVKRLLLTLFDRKELVEHITCFTLADHHGVDDWGAAYLMAYDIVSHDLWPQHQSIEAAIGAILEDPVHLAMEIYGGIFFRCGMLT
jgi:hypothetical protein